MRNIIIVFIVCVFCFSCRKGTLPDPVYYSRIVVYNLGFPGASTIDVRFGNKALGSVDANANKAFDIETDTARLGIYKKGTDSLLADTLLSMRRNSGVALRFGYSPDLGFSSFLSGQAVSPDTVVFQLLNNLGDFYKAYPSITAHIMYFDFTIGWLAETGYTIPDFMHVKLSQRYKYSFTEPVTGAANIYVLELEDDATGQRIIQPGIGVEYIVLSQQYGGTNNIYVLTDVNGDVQCNPIEY